MTAVVPIGKAKPGLKLLVMVGLVVQLSVAVGAVQVATAVVPVVVKLMLAGQLAKTGGVTSLAQTLADVTTTLNVHVALLFLASFAV